ncbi:unnamed protein product, partial [marine sediment metagenome]
MRSTITDHTFPYYHSKEITANLWTRLRDMFKNTEDKTFSFLLEKEFSHDLEFAT